jgi:hypothetical protein
LSFDFYFSSFCAAMDYIQTYLKPTASLPFGAIEHLSELFLDPQIRAQTIQAKIFPRLFEGLKPDSKNLGELILLLAWLSRNDAIKQELLSCNGYSTLARLFVQASAHQQESMVLEVRMLVGRGKDVRQAFFSGSPGLVEVLSKLQETHDGPGFRAAGIVLMISDQLQAQTDVVQNAVRKILAAVKSSEESLRNLALDLLMEAAIIQEVRPVLHLYKIKEYLEPYAVDKKSELNFIASFVQALMSACDVDASSTVGTKPTAPSVIERISATLQTFANTSTVEQTTVRGYVVDCHGILIATRSLATNEANLKELKKQKVVDTLASLMKQRRADLFVVNFDNLEEV